MSRLRVPVFVLLVVYSVALVSIELRTSQDHVRNYVTDIAGPVTFYAVNTTLSVFLLWSASLLFVVSAHAADRSAATANVTRFYWSQAAFFAFLGFDDRFQFHEKLAERLGVPDHFVLLAAAGVEAVILWRWAFPGTFAGMAGVWFAAGLVAGALMLGIDALVPERATLRLTIEDLAKTWAAWLFFLFAWQTMANRLALEAPP